jgi:hypothetical protein
MMLQQRVGARVGTGKPKCGPCVWAALTCGSEKGENIVTVEAKISTRDDRGKWDFEPLLDARPAAKLLGGLHVKTVQRMARRGELPDYHFGEWQPRKIRNLMSTLFNHAMRYDWAEKNPIRPVRQSAKRERTPDVLTAEEIRAVLGKLAGPYYVMAFLAAVTGLRVSELLALKWKDVDFAAEEMSLTRAIVCQHVGPLENSSIAETRSDGCGVVCPVAGLAPTLPLQSRTGLRVRIACKGRRSTALAFKRDVKPHPTRCEVGRNPKARSLARIQTLIRNASERER